MTRDTDTGEFEIDLAGDAPGARKHLQTTGKGTAGPREPAPLHGGTPPDLRERLRAALNLTRDADLADAEDAFRGVYGSSDEYIRGVVGWDIPPHLQWVLTCADPDRLRAGYENKAVVVWEIPFDETRVMVFESLRRGGEK